jgi:hypothetical protein
VDGDDLAGGQRTKQQIIGIGAGIIAAIRFWLIGQQHMIPGYDFDLKILKAARYNVGHKRTPLLMIVVIVTRIIRIARMTNGMNMDAIHPTNRLLHPRQAAR